MKKLGRTTAKATLEPSAIRMEWPKVEHGQVVELPNGCIAAPEWMRELIRSAMLDPLTFAQNLIDRSGDLDSNYDKLSWLNTAMEILERDASMPPRIGPPPSLPRMVQPIMDRAAVHGWLGNHAAAERDLARVVGILRRHGGEIAEVDLGLAMSDHAQALSKLGRHKEALKEFKSALAWYCDHEGNEVNLPDLIQDVAECYRNQDNKDCAQIVESLAIVAKDEFKTRGRAIRSMLSTLDAVE